MRQQHSDADVLLVDDRTSNTCGLLPAAGQHEDVGCTDSSYVPSHEPWRHARRTSIHIYIVGSMTRRKATRSLRGWCVCGGFPSRMIVSVEELATLLRMWEVERRRVHQ